MGGVKMPQVGPGVMVDMKSCDPVNFGILKKYSQNTE